jgi:hypothetical protein
MKHDECKSHGCGPFKGITPHSPGETEENNESFNQDSQFIARNQTQ